jgi:hypothetical protein
MQPLTHDNISIDISARKNDSGVREAPSRTLPIDFAGKMT